MTTKDKNNKKYADTPNTPFSVESPIFPTQNYIRSKILALLEYADENTIVEIKNNYDVNDLIEGYYNSPEDVFHEIITQQQQTSSVRQAQEEELKAEAVRKNVLYQQQILQNICKSQGLSAYPMELKISFVCQTKEKNTTLMKKRRICLYSYIHAIIVITSILVVKKNINGM